MDPAVAGDQPRERPLRHFRNGHLRHGHRNPQDRATRHGTEEGVVGRRAPEQGMTLVELMVTMVIAAIVAASTFMFFAGQQRVYETQTKMLNVQQNVWASMEVLSRFVRSAGSGMYGCVRPVGGIVASPPLNRSPTGPDPDDSDDPPVVLAYAIFPNVRTPACARTTAPPCPRTTGTVRCNEFPPCGSLTRWTPINPRAIRPWNRRWDRCDYRCFRQSVFRHELRFAARRRRHAPPMCHRRPDGQLGHVPAGRVHLAHRQARHGRRRVRVPATSVALCSRQQA